MPEQRALFISNESRNRSNSGGFKPGGRLGGDEATVMDSNRAGVGHDREMVALDKRLFGVDDCDLDHPNFSSLLS